MQQMIQKKEMLKEKDTAGQRIPQPLKQRLETSNGIALDSVRIHYSSERPEQIGALAYAEGNQVYLGPGQERHLHHELGHVIQQKKGYVHQGHSLNNISVNNDPQLERQADAIGRGTQSLPGQELVLGKPVIQRKVGMEYQTVGKGVNVYTKVGSTLKVNESHGTELATKDDVKITADGGDLEYVTSPENELTLAGRTRAKTHGDNAGRIHRSIKSETFPTGGGTLIENIAGKKYLVFTQITDDAGNKNDYAVRAKKNTAHPQATVGVKLTKIYDLLNQMSKLEDGGSGSSQKRELHRGSTKKGIEASTVSSWMSQGAAKAGNTLRKHYNIVKDPMESRSAWVGRLSVSQKRLLGLLSLLSAYHQACLTMAEPGKRRYCVNAKNAMPVMSRTSLYDIYQQLDAAEQTAFTALLSSAETRQTLFGEGAASKIILAAEYGDYKDKVTLRAWLTGLRGGRDILQDHFHHVSEIDNGTDPDSVAVRGKYGIAQSTDIDYGNDAHGNMIQGALVELRGLERGVQSERWGEIAELVAEMIYAINTQKHN